MTDPTPTTPDPQLLTAVRAALRAADKNGFDYSDMGDGALAVDLYDCDEDVGNRATELSAPEEDVGYALDLVEEAVRQVRAEDVTP